MRFSKIKPTITFTNFFQIGAFVLGILLVSCENEEEQSLPLEQNQSISLLFDKTGIDKAGLKEKLTYKNYHLTNLMEEVLRSNLDFDQQMRKKSGKTEDSSTIYFEDLLKEDLQGKGQTILIDSVQFSMDAFVELDGESWYPYVHKIKEGRGSEPLYLINSYDPDSEKEIVQGYRLDTTGQLELKYRDLSEDDVFGPNPVKEAIGNDIYLLGISPDGQEYPLPDPISEDIGGGGGTSNTYVKMQYVKIKDKKESWIEKADVKFEVVAVGANSLNPGEYSTHCGVNAGLGCYWNGSFLVHCNNSELGDKRLINRSMGITQTGAFANIAAYVVFEYDSWPAPPHEYEKILNGESLKVGYRSYQTPYDELTANFHEQNPYNLINGRNLSRNNSDIEYNFK